MSTSPAPGQSGGGGANDPSPGSSGGHRKRVWVRAAVGIMGAFLAVVLLLAFTPLLDDDLESHPAPTSDYASAMARASGLLAADGADIDPRCRSQVLTQGRRTAKSVVLLHGYTNCPQQFAGLARAYSDAGYNVVVARIPQHGKADRMTRALSDLRPGELTALGDDAVDIAAGLGQQVTVVGLSGGGTLAAWLAGERDDVSQAVLMAPLMVPKVLPESLVGPVARLSSVLPDLYLWWDGKLKEQLSTPPYAYPRYSLHSLGALLAVGRRAQGDIDRTSRLDRLVVVTNDNDGAVKNAAIDRLGERLGKRATTTVTHVFSKDLGYKHDIVDLQGENAKDLPAIYATLGPLLGLPDLADAIPAANRE